MAKTYSAQSFNAQHFANSAFPGGGSGVAPPTGCVGLYYAERSDIELAFGKTNTEKWADVNNDANATEIADRICWALKSGHSYINDRLNGGPYVIPFVLPYPVSIILCTSYYAGVLLYDSRGITDMQEDGTEKNQVSFFRKWVEEYIMKILANRANIVGVDRRDSSPFVVSNPLDSPDPEGTRFFGTKPCSRS